MSAVAIAPRYNTSYRTIYRWLDEYGIGRRTPGETNRMLRVGREQPARPSPPRRTTFECKSCHKTFDLAEGDGWSRKLCDVCRSVQSFKHAASLKPNVVEVLPSDLPPEGRNTPSIHIPSMTQIPPTRTEARREYKRKARQRKAAERKEAMSRLPPLTEAERAELLNTFLAARKQQRGRAVKAARRDVEIIALAKIGLSNRAIGQRLGLDEDRVKSYRRRINRLLEKRKG